MTPNTKKQFSKISRAIKSLNEAMTEIQKEFPKANYFLEDCGNFLVLSDESHDDSQYHYANHDVVVHREHLKDSSGGGW